MINQFKHTHTPLAASVVAYDSTDYRILCEPKGTGCDRSLTAVHVVSTFMTGLTVVGFATQLTDLTHWAECR